MAARAFPLDGAVHGEGGVVANRSKSVAAKAALVRRQTNVQTDWRKVMMAGLAGRFMTENKVQARGATMSSRWSRRHNTETLIKQWPGR